MTLRGQEGGRTPKEDGDEERKEVLQEGGKG